jgi:hypothetical protein
VRGGEPCAQGHTAAQWNRTGLQASNLVLVRQPFTCPFSGWIMNSEETSPALGLKRLGGEE